MLTLTNMIRGANGLLNLVKRSEFENDREMYRNIALLKGAVKPVHNTYPTLEALAVHCLDLPKKNTFRYDWAMNE